MTGLGFADFGEVEVDEGGLEAAVAEVGGELPEVDASFEEVGGVAVAEGVDGEFLVFFGETAFGFGDFDGCPDAGFGHVVSSFEHGLPECLTGAFPSTTDAGEEPVGITMGFPEEAKAGEEFGGDGDVSLLSAFGVVDTDGEPLGVNVLGLDGEGFAHA